MKNVKKKGKRQYKVELIDDKKVFIKNYYDNSLDLENLVRDEYEKGKRLNELINYPKPLKFEKNKIFYEYLDIRTSLYDLLNKDNNCDSSIIIKVAKFLKKIHKYNIIHGDLNTINIILTKDNKLFFIDASFSEYANKNRVKFEKVDIYQDISLFLIFLGSIRSLSKFWFIFQNTSKNRLIQLFIDSYFKDIDTKFNPRLNAAMENKFFENYLKSIQNRVNFLDYINHLIWNGLIKFFILRNRWKYGI